MAKISQRDDERIVKSQDGLHTWSMKQGLRVMFFYSGGSSMTGGPRSTLNLMVGLKEKGLQPLFVSSFDNALAEKVRERNIPVEIVPRPSILTAQDRQVLNYSVWKKGQSIRALIHYSNELKEVAESYRVHGVWARSIKAVLFLTPAVHRLSLPLVWDIGLGLPSRGWIKLFHWTGLATSHRVVTQAKAQPDQLFDSAAVRIFNSKFTTIYPGIANERISRLQKARKRNVNSKGLVKIICVGTIHPRKNQLMVLQALSSDRELLSRARLRIVGPTKDEGYFSELEGFVRAHNLEESVEFLGWRDDVPELLGQSDIKILCSEREGVPHVLREAMFAKVPVIATAVGGVPEVVEHGETGFLVPPKGVDDLRQHLKYLVCRPDKRRAMGEKAVCLAEARFSSEAWISANYDMLTQVCDGR